MPTTRNLDWQAASSPGERSMSSSSPGERSTSSSSPDQRSMASERR